ncbi:MAG: MBL fold metallo-hydrolase [Halobacteriales archaeon]
MDLHPVEAGQVRGTRSQLNGRRPVALRNLWAMLDRRWAPSRPSFAWIVDHPAGHVVVDAGPVAHPADPTRWRTHYWHPHYPLAYRSRIGPDAGLRRGLEARDLDAGDVGTVVLTHLHPDHVGALAWLEPDRVVVDRRELAFATSWRGRLLGLNPGLWPASTPFDPVEATAPEGVEIPGIPGIRLLYTPGHTHHHCSTIIERDGPDALLAGDAVYDLDHLRTRRLDGVATRPSAARRSMDTIDDLARSRDLVVLPSHDPDGPDRLDAGAAYRPEA